MTARAFLRALDPIAGAFAFQLIPDAGAGAPRSFHGVPEGAIADHDRGAAVFVAVNETVGNGRCKENIVRVRAVFQEDDSGYRRSFPLKPSMVVESSPGRFHRYWLVEDQWPADERGRADFDRVMERMIKSYSSDPGAKDISRVLRVPGFLNRKRSEPFLVRIVNLTGKRYSRRRIVEAFPAVPRIVRPIRQWRPRSDDDRRIRNALAHINADDRDIWLRIGMALKSHYGEAGRDLWDRWSRQSKKFDEPMQNRTWRSLRGSGVNIGTIFYYGRRGVA